MAGFGDRIAIAIEVIGGKAAQSEFTKTGAAAQTMGGQTQQAQSRMGQLSGAAIATAAKVGIYGAALYGAGKVAVDLANKAGDLGEAQNKVGVLFGRSAGRVKDWAKDLASSFGIAQTQALNTAGAFGSMLRTAGLSSDEAAQMSQRFVELGADMASFNNIPIDEAFEKLRSGLAGEAEPLRTVGVLLSESRVQQEAYNTGIAEQGAKLTEQQKVLARYNLILKDTKLQQGDFARTSDGLANQQRILAAEFENLQTTLGTLLLPTVVDLTSDLTALLSVAGKIPGAFGKIADISAGLPGPFKNVGKAAKDALISAAPVVGPALKAKDIIGGLLGGDDKESSKFGDIQKRAADAQRKLVDLAVEGKKATQDYRDAKKELAAADEELAAAEKKAESALGDLGSATDDQKKREEELKAATEARIGATIASFDSNLAAEQGWVSLREKVEAAGEEEDAHKRQLELTGAALDQAGLLASAAADNYEKLTGDTATAEQKQKFMRDALAEVAAKFPELAPLILGYIAELDAIPPTKNTDVTANTEPAKIAIAQYEEWLNGLPPLTRKISMSVGYDMDAPWPGGRDNSLVTPWPLAKGGPVDTNRLYLVGEKGPELFVPSTAGSIVPNDRLGGSGGTPVGASVRNYSVNVAVGPTANLAEVGRVTVEAIRAYERGSGNSWRNN